MIKLFFVISLPSYCMLPSFQFNIHLLPVHLYNFSYYFPSVLFITLFYFFCYHFSSFLTSLHSSFPFPNSFLYTKQFLHFYFTFFFLQNLFPYSLLFSYLFISPLSALSFLPARPSVQRSDASTNLPMPEK